MVFGIVLGFFLVPLYGFIGTALALMISDFVLMLSYQIRVSRTAYRISLLGIVARFALICIILTTALYFLRTMSIFLAMPVGMLIYLVALVAVGGIGLEEYTMVKRLVFPSQRIG